jgi:hypothetical protein
MRFAIALLTTSVLAACEPAPPEPAACSTGEVWTGGDDGSALMHPGMDCIGCHAQGGGEDEGEDESEGPLYTVAGTVMGAFDDPDDCYGVEGVTVNILDADSTLFQLVTNAAGNFFTNDPVVLPYTITLDDGVAQNAMVTPQSDGGCAVCHTETGENAAPGRIVAP